MALSVLFVLYCLEAGLFFTIAPWTRFWTLNPILHYTSSISLIADNAFVRGLVSGFGLVHLLLCAREISEIIERARQRERLPRRR